MLTAAKEEIFCAPMVWTNDYVLPLAAEGAGKNTPQGYGNKNFTSHLGRSFTNSTSALGIELTVRWESVGSNDSARYYDSSTGRFLGEDQIGNDEGANLYLYTRNNPINFNDPTGLYRLVGFSPDDAQKMRDAIDSAIKKLGETCDGCAGPNGPKIAQVLQNATFVYVRNLRSQDGTLEECGNARPINSKTIHVGSAAFSAKKCCRLDSSLAHEATHKVTKSKDEHGPNGPLDVEDKCFGCH